MKPRLAPVVLLALLGLVAPGMVGPVAAHAAAGRERAQLPGRIRVLLIGESEAGTLAGGAPRPPEHHGLAARPDLVLWDSTLLGCSISSAPVFVLASGEAVANQCGGTGYWQQRWTADVQATKPDVVFVMAGARDVYDVAGPDGTVIHPGEPVWMARYTADVRELFRIAGSTGAPIVAVKPTCFGPNTLPDGEPTVPEKLDPGRARAVAAAWVAAARASRLHLLHLLDLDDVVCPGGVADPVLRADGVHFTVAGADRLAPTVAAALRRAVTAASARRGSAPRPRSGPADRD
jgi:lysophospholipase L1-like esterase